MTKEQKLKLLKFLYPNEEICNFMCNDFYQELANIIPYHVCISAKNLVQKNRENNWEFVKEKLITFLNNNKNYSTELARLYRESQLNNKIDEFLIGYVFFIANTNKTKEVDIFKDKRSICYSEISIINII